MTDINFGTVFICMTSTFSHSTPSSFIFYTSPKVTAKPVQWQ